MNNDDEGWFIKRLLDNHKDSGRVVEVKSGRGIIPNNAVPINGKMPMQMDDGRKLLCSQENIKLIGYYD